MGFSRLGQTEGKRKQESRHWHLSCVKRKIVCTCSCTKDDYHCHGCLASRRVWAQQRQRSESCSFVLVKYVIHKVLLSSVTERGSRSDHKGQKLEDRESRLPAVQQISKSQQCISEGITFKMKGECRLIIQWAALMWFYLFIIIALICYVFCWVLTAIHHPGNSDNARRTCFHCRRSRFTTETTTLLLWKVCFFFVFFCLCFKVRETGMWTA